MYTGHGSDPMPSDKLMKLFIIQSISAFVANDYETGVHFLKEIKQAYAEHMGSLNPTLKKLAKEIIQSVDLFNPDGSGFVGASMSNEGPTPSSTGGDPTMPSFGENAEDASPSSDISNQQQSSQGSEQPKSVASELQELLKRRKERRRK